MARAAEQFRIGDVAVWGLLALAAWSLALLAGNVAGTVPDSLLAGLHASRLSATTLAQVQGQVGELEAETIRLRSDSNRLSQRFTMGEAAANDLTRRLAAVEGSLPRIIETQTALIEAQGLDPTLTGATDPTTTGAIDNRGRTVFEVSGGSVAIQQVPMILSSGGNRPAAPGPEPLTGFAPPPVIADGSTQGVALGLPAATDPAADWADYMSRVGTLLVGMSPVLGGSEGGARRLIAGPVLDRASAIELCARLESVSITCSPVPFAGEPLPATD